LGLGQDEVHALGINVAMKKAEHISTYFARPRLDSPLAGIGPADVHIRDPRQLPLISAGAQIIGNGVLGQSADGHIVFCQLVPWQFGPSAQSNLKRTYRRTSFLVSRLLGNMGVRASTPLLERFHRPVQAETKQRWLEGLYLDQPEEWDDPYRFFRW
jgi:hypothetical protein